MTIPPRRIRSADDAVEIAVHDLARHDGAPPVLISHATGFNARTYQPLVDAIGPAADVIGLDHRGHGFTTAPDGWAVDWRPFGDDVATLAAAAWPERGVVGFGHSMGGAALLMAAASHPELFRSLVLFEPIAIRPADRSNEPGDNSLAAGALRRRERFGSIEAAIDNFAQKPPLALMHPESLRNYVEYGFRPVDDGDEITLRCRPQFESDTFASASNNGVWELLPSIDTPTLVIAGAVEPDTPATWAAEMADLLTNGHYLQLDELTHFGPMSHPSRVAEIVADVVAEGLGPS